MSVLSRSSSRGGLVAAVVALLVSACASAVTSQEPAPGVAPGSEAAEVLAIVDGTPITVADLDEFIGDDLATLEFQYGSQRYEMLKTGLESAMRQRLIESAAAAQGITADEFVQQALEGKVDVSDQQISEWYAANQARLQGRPLEMLRPAIRQFLFEQQRDVILGEITDELAAGQSVELRLEPFRVQLDIEGFPTIGAEQATVTLVEFSDFECPFCGGFVETIERVKREYEGRVKLVFRQFPLTQIHPNAEPAAQASLCAAEQGKFWELHDLMFAEQHSLATADLRDKAQRLEMDIEAFEACIQSQRYADQVAHDLQVGQRVGVTGTPALFVNGRPLPGGAVPFEDIAELIDEELERAGR